MKAPLLLVSLCVCSAAYAQDAPAPAPDAAPDTAAAPPTSPPKRQPFVGKGREGFTFEIGLGAGYTSEYANSRVRLSALEGFSVGAFVAKDFALLMRLGASVTGRWTSGSFDDGGTLRRSHTAYVVDQLYLAPIAQYFLNDWLMVAGGVGPTVVLRATNTAVDGTSNGAASSGDHAWGVAGSFRFGVTVYQSRNIGALRVSLEAVPAVIQRDWNILTGLVVEAQLY